MSSGGPPSSEPGQGLIAARLRPEIPGYRILGEIGRGASAVVFRAVQTSLGREVALKVLALEGESGRRRALRLMREARIGGSLAHPRLVRVLDAGVEGEWAWLAMDLVPGRSLDESLEQGGAWAPEAAHRLGQELLEALFALHERRIVHRDVKPGNVLLGEDGSARLIDLGLAREITEDPRLTRDQSGLGTPLYMAPEQIRNARSADERADVYGFGATLYHVLTGQPPFLAPSITGLVQAALSSRPLAPSRRRPGLNPDFDRVILRCLARAPWRRYASVRDLAADWNRIAAGGPRAARRPWILLAAGLVLLGVAAFLLARRVPGPPAEVLREPGVASSTPAGVELPGPPPADPSAGIRRVERALLRSVAALADLRDAWGRRIAEALARSWRAIPVLWPQPRASAPPDPPAGLAARALREGRIEEARRHLEALRRAGSGDQLARLESELWEREEALLQEAAAVFDLLRRSSADPLPRGECSRRAREIAGRLPELRSRLAAAEREDLLGAGLLELFAAAVEAAGLLEVIEARVLEAVGRGGPLAFRPEERGGRLLPPREVHGVESGVLLAQDGLGHPRRYPLDRLTLPSLQELAGALESLEDRKPWLVLAYWSGEPGEAQILGGLDALAEPFRRAVIELEDRWAVLQDTQEARAAAEAIVGACRKLGAGDAAGASELLAAIPIARIARSPRRDLKDLALRARRLRDRVEGLRPDPEHPGATSVHQDEEAQALWVRYDFPAGAAGWRLEHGSRASAQGLDLPATVPWTPLRLEELPGIRRQLEELPSGDLAMALELWVEGPEFPEVLGLSLGKAQVWWLGRIAQSRPMPAEPLHGLEGPPPAIRDLSFLGVAGGAFPPRSWAEIGSTAPWRFDPPQGRMRVRARLDSRRGRIVFEAQGRRVELPMPQALSAEPAVGLVSSGPLTLLRLDLLLGQRR
jgi:hypothetical protein